MEALGEGEERGGWVGEMMKRRDIEAADIMLESKGECSDEGGL